jgi:hypothetical protein
MSDSTNSSSQQTIVIALVVVAVLLAALVGVLVYQQSQAAKLAAPVVAAPSASQNPAGMGGSTGGAATGAAAGPFDPKTATKVPAGVAPLAFLKAYNEDIIGGKFDAAYKMLPLDKQQSYGDAKSYAEQVKGYGISGYKLGKPVENGDTMSIATLQENPAMPITYTWNFKKVGDTWYVESRVMGGSVE